MVTPYYIAYQDQKVIGIRTHFQFWRTYFRDKDAMGGLDTASQYSLECWDLTHSDPNHRWIWSFKKKDFKNTIRLPIYIPFATVKQAEAETGASARTIQRKCRNGTFTSFKWRTIWYILKDGAYRDYVYEKYP